MPKNNQDHELDVSIREGKAGWKYTIWEGSKEVEESSKEYINSYAALDAGKERRNQKEVEEKE